MAELTDLVIAKGKDAPKPPPKASTASKPQTPTYYRNLYKAQINFKDLAAEDDEIAPFIQNGHINFRDPAAVMQLTKSLLRRDFALDIQLPSDRLCPPVPNRHAYVQWIGALLETTGHGNNADSPAMVVGADVGTGASCIYPLLACAQHADWQFVATDIDATSLAAARDNVRRNGLQHRIRVVGRTPLDALVPVAAVDTDGKDSKDSLPRTLSFVMTNPPFYASAADMEASARAKDEPPHTACTGAPVEMIYEDYEAGGEVAFVGRIISESVVLRDRVGWYTAMVGKLSSLVALVERLRSPAVGVDNYAVTALVTGSKTRRWALGWSYAARRPTVEVARGSGGFGGSASSASSAGLDSCRHILPPITSVDVWSMPGAAHLGHTPRSVWHIGTTLDAILRRLELDSWDWTAARLKGTGRTRENVWGRAWRRKKMREAAAGTTGSTTTKTTNTADTKDAFGFEIEIRMGVNEAIVVCRWLEGHTEAIYQSFCGFLKTKLNEAYPT